MASKYKKYWKSLVTGNEYDWDEFENHGYGGIREYGDWGGVFKRKRDLPKAGYPYTIIDEWKEKLDNESKKITTRI